MQHFLLISLLFTIITHSHSQCLEHQKILLLQLRNELIFNASLSTNLVRWNRSDECCKWYGVECDVSGHVVSLHLDGEGITAGIGDSSSLFGLNRLRMLNLAHNDFNYTRIPRGIGNLTYLTHLNLSNAAFGGQVPAKILSLRRLVSLDISGGAYREDGWIVLEHPNLETLVRNLTRLRELYLGGVFITSSDERRKWSHFISSYLPNLTALSLVDCFLFGPLAKSFWKLHSLSVLRLDGNDLSTVVPGLFTNFPNLTTLSLSGCSLNGTFPDNVFRIPTLRSLDVSGNELLSGSIPPFTQTGSLESIVLSNTNFSGSLPSSISNLRTLSKLDLSYCNFTGSIPSTFANLSSLTYVDLSANFFTGSLPPSIFEGPSNILHLHLEYNSFSGHIPLSLFRLPSLLELNLRSNQFSGEVGEFLISNVTNMISLDLSSNRLEGRIPDSLFQLRSLESLSLSQNLFNGTFQLDKIRSLANLTLINLSLNDISVEVENNNNLSTYGLPKLKEARLVSCNMHDFPRFMDYTNMVLMDLSDNLIVGELPGSIWGTRLEYLSLANNSLSGTIPASLCTNTKLDVLDLSDNKLSGTIPPCLVTNIRVFDIGRNNISRCIPDNFSHNFNLEKFDVNNNALEGRIPESLKSCQMLEYVNVGNNMINDTFPCMLSYTLRILVLHSNRFHGEVACHNHWVDLQVLDISSNNFSGSLGSVNFSSWWTMTQFARSHSDYYMNTVTLVLKGLETKFGTILTNFTAIDFSCNNFSGEIPNEIGVLSLRSLLLLNLSHNALTGSIPKSCGKLGELESLDLSRNQLTGHIPTELSRLTFLSVLNVSYNRLSGEIPKGRQLQTFPADSFVGNPGLCGFNLNISCTRHTDDDDGIDGNEEEKKKTEIEWDYVSVALGYVVGLGSIVWLLLFCRSFRRTYFDKVDEVVEEMFDAGDRGRRRRRRRTCSRRRQVQRH